VVSVFTYFWFNNWQIGVVIAGAMLINLCLAAAAGFAVPLLLKRLKIDPALAGGVVLMAITDVAGYMSFLGLGTLLLL
jgi:magnesium transporter